MAIKKLNRDDHVTFKYKGIMVEAVCDGIIASYNGRNIYLFLACIPHAQTLYDDYNEIFPVIFDLDTTLDLEISPNLHFLTITELYGMFSDLNCDVNVLGLWEKKEKSNSNPLSYVYLIEVKGKIFKIIFPCALKLKPENDSPYRLFQYCYLIQITNDELESFRNDENFRLIHTIMSSGAVVSRLAEVALNAMALCLKSK